MELFHKYQSRSFQFALELIAMLAYGDRVPRRAVEQLANRLGLDYADQTLRPMEEAGIIRIEQGDCLPGTLGGRFVLPLSRVEENYFRDILQRREAACFLSQEEIEKLKSSLGTPDGTQESIQLPGYAAQAMLPQRENLRVILQAMRQGRMVDYEYRTREDRRPKSASAVPWKVEYGAFDRRWWMIFYDPAQQRTIKARMENLSHLRLGKPAGITEDEIEMAMDRLLEAEPVVLQVTPTRGALERCFLTFEDQLFVETHQENREAFRLCFRWYRFDRGVILRKLLFLGPGVTLLGPASLQEELLALLEQARTRQEQAIL